MTEPILLPKRYPYHWETEAGYQMTIAYLEKHREDLPLPHISDESISQKLCECEGGCDLIQLQTVVKERIRWLSVRLATMQIKSSEKDRQINLEIHPEPIIRKSRYELLMGNKTDFLLANLQYVACPSDRDFGTLKAAAAERLNWLSRHVAFEQLKCELNNT